MRHCLSAHYQNALPERLVTTLRSLPAPLLWKTALLQRTCFIMRFVWGVRTRGVYAALVWTGRATRGTRLLFLLFPGGPSCVNLMTFFVTQGIEKLDPPVSAIG